MQSIIAFMNRRHPIVCQLEMIVINGKNLIFLFEMFSSNSFILDNTTTRATGIDSKFNGMHYCIMLDYYVKRLLSLLVNIHISQQLFWNYFSKSIILSMAVGILAQLTFISQLKETNHAYIFKSMFYIFQFVVYHEMCFYLYHVTKHRNKNILFV